MTIRFSDITGGGIPYGDNAGRPSSPGIGKLYSNGEERRLELYTADGWSNIVQETPGVSSVTGTYIESTGTGTVVISGTNFVNGAYATAIGTNGVGIEASSTVFDSLVQLTATFSGLSGTYEPYDIKVTNPSNLFGMLVDAFYINNQVSWTTSSGSLGTVNGTNSISYTVAASDQENSAITYASSNLPEWLSLNSSTGALTGTAPVISSNTTYTFTITASDGANTPVARSFSITVNALPSGGTITTSGSYRVHTFTGNGTFTVPNAISAQYLVIAGGGSSGWGAGGGNEAGGGGAGGYRSSVTGESSGGLSNAESVLSLSATNYSVVIGAGGAGVAGGRNNGSDSSFHTITSIGGGAGGANNNGASGGSGGGGSHNMTSGGAGTSGQGHAGGTPTTSSAAGGGGGAGGSGAGGRSSASPATGGIGIASSITGSSVYRAGGGGGGNPGTANYGGNGGGGNGQGSQGSLTNGTDNTGGGGGGVISGSGTAGGSGGSGIVIIRYAI